jgi:GntR family transcriptional regulator, arabinose operon transcriptional repressor
MEAAKLLPAKNKTTSLKRERLRQHLVTELKSGRLMPGQALPTELDISRQLKVSRNTVRHALGELEQQGLVRRVQGKGTFVTEKANAPTVVRTSSLAIVVPDVTTGYYRQLFADFERFANAAGSPVTICNSSNNVDRQGNHILSLLHQRVAGVVLNSSTHGVTPTYHVTMLQDAGIPVVLLHRPVPGVRAPVLEIPGTQAGSQAGRMLVEAGHRRVAYFDSHRTKLGERYLEGLQSALREVGADISEEQISFGGTTEFDPADYHCHELHMESELKRMMSSKMPPTAVFLGWAESAERMYLIAMRMGLRVPEDLSIVCFGGAHQSGAILSKLTSVTLDETAAAQRAVELLIEMREGRRPLCDSEIIPIPLGVRIEKTLAPPKAAK